MVKQSFCHTAELENLVLPMVFVGFEQKLKKSVGKTKSFRTAELENLVLSMVFVGFEQKLQKSDGKTNFSDISRI